MKRGNAVFQNRPRPTPRTYARTRSAVGDKLSAGWRQDQPCFESHSVQRHGATTRSFLPPWVFRCGASCDLSSKGRHSARSAHASRLAPPHPPIVHKRRKPSPLMRYRTRGRVAPAPARRPAGGARHIRQATEARALQRWRRCVGNAPPPIWPSWSLPGTPMSAEGWFVTA
jgi:hypothetical protein